MFDSAVARRTRRRAAPVPSGVSAPSGRGSLYRGTGRARDRSGPGHPDRARRKAMLDEAIRSERRAVLVVNTRSRSGRDLYADAKRLLTRNGLHHRGRLSGARSGPPAGDRAGRDRAGPQADHCRRRRRHDQLGRRSFRLSRRGARHIAARHREQFCARARHPARSRRRRRDTDRQAARSPMSISAASTTIISPTRRRSACRRWSAATCRTGQALVSASSATS